jgi:CHAT domain-containing protein
MNVCIIRCVSAVLFLTAVSAHAQSIDDAVSLWKEGWRIEQAGESKEDLEAAADKYKQARKIFERHTHHRGMWGTAVNLGKITCLLGNYHGGIRFFEQAVTAGERSGDREALAHGHSGLGGAYFELGRTDEAVSHYEKALDAYKHLGDRTWEGLTLNHIGEILRVEGKYDEALEHYRKAGDAGRSVQSQELEADSLLNIGEIHRLRGAYRKALDHYKQALSLYEGLGDSRSQGIALGHLGTLNENWGRPDEAFDFYKQALTVFSKLGILKEEAGILLSLGRAHHLWGKHERALADYNRALMIHEQIGLSTALPKKLIGNLLLDTGDIDKAESYITGSGLPEALGRLNLVKGDFASARTQYEKLLSQARTTGNVEDLFTAYTGLGRAFEGLEDFNRAADFYQKGMELTEELRSRLLPSERASFLDVKINGFYRSEPAKGLTRVRMKMSRSTGSLATSEATRARAFADKLAQGAQRTVGGVPRSVTSEEERLLSRVAALKKARSSVTKTDNPERYDNLTKKIEAAENRVSELINKLRNDYPAYAAVKYPVPLKLKDSAVRQDEYVIVYDILGEGLGVKLIKGTSIRETYFIKWDRGELESMIRAFLAPFTAKQPQLADFDADLGKELYKRLLFRVLTDVPTGTPLVIIPDGILGILPFEALVIRGHPRWRENDHGPWPGGLRFVGDRHPVSYYQSITALTLARKKRRTGVSVDRALVIADPIFSAQDERYTDSRPRVPRRKKEPITIYLMSPQEQAGVSFPRLKQTGRLAQAIQDLYPGKTDILTGMDANKEFLFNNRLDRYRSVTFATHGYYGNNLPGIQEPVLALTLVGQPLGHDGLLRMTEVTDLKLRAEVVALTACQTGLGRHVSGEGVMGMGRAFQFAGAESVLMSLWSVAEEPSVLLMERFFAHLKETKGDKLASLQRARDDIRRAGFKHPFFWAAFILVGEPH